MYWFGPMSENMFFKKKKTTGISQERLTNCKALVLFYLLSTPKGENPLHISVWLTENGHPL